MKKYEPTGEDLAEKIKELEERLFEAEQINRAIRNGEVDALVMREGGEEHVYTLKGADHGYRMLVESINEGALILAPDDSIYYCNRCMGEMLGLPINKIIGSTLVSYVDGSKHEELIELIRESRQCGKSRGRVSDQACRRDDPAGKRIAQLREHGELQWTRRHSDRSDITEKDRAGTKGPRR